MKKSEVIHQLEETERRLWQRMGGLSEVQGTMQKQINKLTENTSNLTEDTTLHTKWGVDVVEKQLADVKALVEARVPDPATKLKRVTFTHGSKTRTSNSIVVSMNELRRLNDLEVSYKVTSNSLAGYSNLMGIELIPYYTTDNTRALITLVNQLFSGRFVLAIKVEDV